MKIEIELTIDDPEMLRQNIVVHLNSETLGLTTSNGSRGKPDLFTFMQSVIEELQQHGSVRTSEAYKSALRSFRHFYGERPLPFVRMDDSLLSAYEDDLTKRGVTQNTVSFYMRILRAVYNRAVRKRLTADAHPFSSVYTAVGKTKKRAIDLNVIRKIAVFPCERKNALLARDMFMFSFYTRGMSFVDMAFLKKSDLTEGLLSYTRSKTGQRMTVKWELPMQQIVDGHPTNPDSPYLLPLITHYGCLERNQYRYQQCVVNKELKVIGKQLGIRQLTMYVARHSWATVAKSINVPLEVISLAMGHASEKTTYVYLKSIESTYVDQANYEILKLLEMEK